MSIQIVTDYLLGRCSIVYFPTFSTVCFCNLFGAQKHGYGREGAYPVSDTYPARIRLGYGRDTYPRRVRVSLNSDARNSRTDTYPTATSRPRAPLGPPALLRLPAAACCSAPPMAMRATRAAPPASAAPPAPLRSRPSAPSAEEGRQQGRGRSAGGERRTERRGGGG